MAGAKLLAGLNEPPEIDPANNINPTTKSPITNPAKALVFLVPLCVLPKIVSINTNVVISSTTNV